jgi:hypothetical protein
MARYRGTREEMLVVKIDGCTLRVVDVLRAASPDQLDGLNAQWPDLARALRQLSDRVQQRPEQESYRDGGLL